jgi:ribosomal protein S18 acetylase RimI-like enzyme
MRDATPKAITRDHDSFAETLTLASGERIVFRPLKQEDSALLAGYFSALSADTRKRFAPHAFTKEQAEMLCAEINYGEVIRLLAVTDNVQQQEAVAYFILRLELNDGDEKRYRAHGMNLDRASVCSIAPSVADDYQGRGLGSVVMDRALALARRLGRRQAILQGGVQAANSRAIHFYEKCGFCKVGSFSTAVENYDMIVDLTQSAVIRSSEQLAAPDKVKRGASPCRVSNALCIGK